MTLEQPGLGSDQPNGSGQEMGATYRVLISPIDESSKQWNNKTKPKHSNFPML